MAAPIRSPFHRLEKLPGSRRAAMPVEISPQLATLVDRPPSGGGWLHELKLDGYRMLCHLSNRKARFWSRNRKDWTSKFPEIASAIQTIKAEKAIVDGEVVVMDASGRSSFQKLQQSMGKRESGFVLIVFDLIYLDGFDLTRVSLKERKRLLKQLIDSGDRTRVLRYSDHQEGNGALFFEHACKEGLEGIISKRADSPYEFVRNMNWQKIKCSKRQEFVIAGYTPSSKGLAGFGSLILGVYDGDALVYAGRVGTGFSLQARVEIGKALDKISRPTMPFAARPRVPGITSARWAQPRLVAEVAFTEWTSAGSIRHPSFQGLRRDKKPKEVRREIPRD